MPPRVALRRTVPVALAAAACAVAAAPASAASCPSFTVKSARVSGVTVRGVSCGAAKSDLTRALNARRGRKTWSCAGFKWTASGVKVAGVSGSRRIAATVR